VSFLCFPLMVESVAWITEHKNVVSMTLMLGRKVSQSLPDPPDPCQFAQQPLPRALGSLTTQQNAALVETVREQVRLYRAGTCCREAPAELSGAQAQPGK
jgi:hypothetical protein